MVSQKVTVSNPTGIHARPAATLAKTAAPFKSSIILVAGEKRLQAKSVLNLMSAAINVEQKSQLSVMVKMKQKHSRL